MRHEPHKDDSYIRETHIDGVPVEGAAVKLYLSTRVIAALVGVFAVVVVVGTKIFFGDDAINYGIYAACGVVVAGVIVFRVFAGYWPLQGSGKLEL